MHHDENIYRAAELLKVPEQRFLDFSSPVNPLGVSKKIKAELRKHLKHLDHYPDPDCVRMRRHIARHINVDKDRILCGNGSSELVRLVVSALRPRNVLIPVPTSSEYESAVRATHDLNEDSAENEGAFRFLTLERKNSFRIDVREFSESMDGCDMAFLSNPNNPTGAVLRRSDILDLAQAAFQRKCYLVVDEAFIDFVPRETVVEAVKDNPSLIVLRSMTHFYALAGLRVGYGIFPDSVVHKLQKKKEQWSVNSLAQRAAVIALKDKTYKKQTVEVMESEKAFLEESFRMLKIEYIPTDANFYLLHIPGAEELHEFLLKRSILVKRCGGFRGLDNTMLRIAVKNHRENALLIKAMKEFFSQRQ